MTDILIDIVVPSVDGGYIPAVGSLTFTPTARYIDGVSVVLPAGFMVQLIDGRATAILETTTPEWVWKIEEGFVTGETRYVEVDNTLPVRYQDLRDIDPTTLTPTGPPPVDVWVAALDSATVSATTIATAAADIAVKAATQARDDASSASAVLNVVGSSTVATTNAEISAVNASASASSYANLSAASAASAASYADLSAASAASAASVAVGSGLPSGGTDGQFLGRAAGAPVWVNAPAGGGANILDIFKGAWVAQTAYSQGDLVTANGGLWLAKTAVAPSATFSNPNTVTLVDQSYVGANGNAPLLTGPTNWLPGDIQILTWCSGGSDGVITGWTHLPSYESGNDSIRAWVRTLGVGDSPGVQTYNTSGWGMWILRTYRNLIAPSTMVATASITSPGIVTSSRIMHVWVGSSSNNNAYSISLPSGLVDMINPSWTYGVGAVGDDIPVNGSVPSRSASSATANAYLVLNPTITNFAWVQLASAP